MEKMLFQNENGSAIEIPQSNQVRIYEFGVMSYDGIIGQTTFETWINYETGLYQSWDATGYFAKYMDCYKNRETAIREAKRVLKIKEEE